MVTEGCQYRRMGICNYGGQSCQRAAEPRSE